MDAFVQGCYVPNTRRTGSTIRVQIPCTEAHYGLCVERDVSYFTKAHLAAVQLRAAFFKGNSLSDLASGALLMIVGEWEDQEARHMFLFYSSKRGGHRPFVVFTECEYLERISLIYIYTCIHIYTYTHIYIYT